MKTAFSYISNYIVLFFKNLNNPDGSNRQTPDGFNKVTPDEV
jgi:hypothetical protein